MFRLIFVTGFIAIAASAHSDEMIASVERTSQYGIEQVALSRDGSKYILTKNSNFVDSVALPAKLGRFEITDSESIKRELQLLQAIAFERHSAAKQSAHAPKITVYTKAGARYVPAHDTRHNLMAALFRRILNKPQWKPVSAVAISSLEENPKLTCPEKNQQSAPCVYADFGLIYRQ